MVSCTDLLVEELLINFREVIGEHSGDNIGLSVWKTLEEYEIVHKVCHGADEP